MPPPSESRNPFKLTPVKRLPLQDQVLQYVRLAAYLGLLGYFLFLPMREKAIRIQAREPVEANRPTWVRALELFQIIPPYSDLDRRPAGPVQTGPPPPLPRPTAQADAPRVRYGPAQPPSPAPGASEQRLGQVLTAAAHEAELPDIVVLDVDCGPTGDAFCIAWGVGSRSNSDIHALMRSPTFTAHRGSVSQWAVSAVHWPSGREDTPAFFALGIHTRENVELHRTDFNQRSARLRALHVEGPTRAATAGNTAETP